jgi:hypothetical protein
VNSAGGGGDRLPAAGLDIDGTLVDTNYHHAIAWFRAFRRHDATLPLWRIHRHSSTRAGSPTAGRTPVTWSAPSPSPTWWPPPSRRPAAGRPSWSATRPGTCEAAERAGLQTVAVLTRGFSEAELREAGAVGVFGSLTDLRAQLDTTPLRSPR